MKKIFRRIFCLGSDGGSSTSAVVATKDKDKLEKCPSFGSGDVEAWASTEIEQETFSFLWNLKNFNSIISTTPVSGTTDAKLDDEVKSPVFKGGSQGKSWQLKICPKEKIKKGEYLSAYLTLTSFGDGKDGKIKVRHQISLLDSRGNTVRSQTMNVTTEFQKDTTKLVWIMRRKKILKNSHLLTKDDCLKIHCRIWIVGDFKHKTGSGITLTKDSADELRVKELHGLSDDFGKLLYLSETADVAISTLKHTFMAHRTILTARSPVFKRMLEIDMIESKTRSIDIPDFEKEVVQGMLEYIYTGHTESLVREAPELMQIAEKYQLGGLKENCEIQIANSLTVENAVQVLVLAHLHNATVLKPSVISFINLNKDAVKATKSFQDVAQAKGNSCEYCPKRFSDLTSIIVHTRVHTEEKPFECTSCPKKFSEISRLNVHKRTHTGEKPFKCQICPKEYPYLQSLIVHRRAHAGEKLFQCSLCKKNFASSSSRSVHVKNIHKKRK